MQKFGSNYQGLAHAFIYGGNNFEGECYGRRMFAEGNKLYSYGKHFLIAEKLGGNRIIVNTSSSSVTTSKQQWALRSAIPSYWEVIYVPLSDTKNQTNVIKDMIYQIEKLLVLIPRARTKKEKYITEISYLQNNAKKYIKLFKKKDIKLSKLEKEVLNTPVELSTVKGTFEKIKQNDKNLRAAKKRNITLATKKAKDKELKDLEKWKNFEIHRIYLYNLPVHLRVNFEEKTVETTGGVSVPIDKCQELYRKIKKNEYIQGFKLNDMYKVVSFDKDFLTIGCHKIPTIEVLKYGKIIE